MHDFKQPMINDVDGDIYVTCRQTARGATEDDPYPVQRAMILSHIPWLEPRCCRVNRETAKCLLELSNNGTAFLNRTAFNIVDYFDIWSSVTATGEIKVSKDNALIAYAGERVEPYLLGEIASLEEAA